MTSDNICHIKSVGVGVGSVWKLQEPLRWDLTSERPCSISGVELDGDKLVRLVYLDESGSSTEPFLVVAGVIIDADKQWRLVERNVNELIGKYVPEENQKGFIFHATDMLGGHGIFAKHRERWREALRELLEIPSKFH